MSLQKNEQYPTPKQALETKPTVSDPASHGNGVLDNNKEFEVSLEGKTVYELQQIEEDPLEQFRKLEN